VSQSLLMVPSSAYAAAPARREALPFTVTVATPEELEQVVAVRSTAYLRHGAPGAGVLQQPEADDLRDDVVLLIARSKFDRSVIGSFRFQPNFHQPMHLEGSVKLP
jgi:hypothetical protein